MVKTIVSTLLLLVLLISISIFSIWFLGKTSREFEAQILKVEVSTRSENWAKAKDELKEMEYLWKNTEKYWAILLDHFEIENIDTAISRMTMFIDIEDKSSALGEAASLKLFIKHITAKESLNLKNIF